MRMELQKKESVRQKPRSFKRPSTDVHHRARGAVTSGCRCMAAAAGRLSPTEQLTASPSAGERRPRRATSSARRHLHCDGRSRRLSRGLEKPREHIKMHRVASRKRWRCTCLTVAEQSGVAAWSNDAMRVDFVQQHRTWAS